MKPAALVSLALVLMAGVARAQEPRLVIDSVRVEHGRLLLDFHADSLFTSRLLAGMQRGMTSAARFRAQLWRRRGPWFNAVVAERVIEIKTAYDPWEQIFLVHTAEERRQTRSQEFVRQSWEQHRNLVLADSSKLHPKHSYYVVVELLLEPVSRESLREIRGWLAGEVKSLTRRDSVAAASEERAGVQNRLLDVVIDLTGLGERVLTIKSRPFRFLEEGTLKAE